MSVKQQSGWSEWVPSEDGTEVSFYRLMLIDRPFFRVRLVQTARTLESDGDLSIPIGDTSIKPLAVCIATLIGIAVLWLAARAYSVLLRSLFKINGSQIDLRL